MAKTAFQRLLSRLGLSQGELGRRLRMPKGRVSSLVNGRWRPVRDGARVLDLVRAVLADAGATPAQIASALADRASSPASSNTAPQQKEDADMRLAKQTLSPAARQHFKLFRDPFNDDVEEAKDVFFTPGIRHVREAMWAAARHGGMLAVVGESGSGKSTLRRELADRIRREGAAIVLMEPYVIAMEETDARGRTLRSTHIAEAIVHAIDPRVRLKNSSQARFAQLHALLRNSHHAGNRHVLLIEEAHCLPTATLKHLKRFLELEDGFRKLLSVILLGQPELRRKLGERNPEVREVVQRCEVIELPALDNHLQAYLDFKLRRVGVESAQVFDKGAIEALCAKLGATGRVNTRSGGRAFGQAVQRDSLLYPLAVANVVASAMNLAFSIGAPTVSADLIREV